MILPKVLFRLLIIFWVPVCIAEGQDNTSSKYYGVTINPMLASSDTMALPFPARVSVFTKLFPYASLMLSLGVIDDKPLIAAHRGSPLSGPYEGKVTAVSFRYHPNEKLSGYFAEYSLERVSWTKYSSVSLFEVEETPGESWAHLTMLGIGKTDSTLLGIFNYLSASLGLSWNNTIRTSGLIGRVEAGYYF